METNMIGSKIANARKKINLSQALLAQQLFISPQAVGKWERGESMPDIGTLNRMAKILGVDLNYFSDNAQSAETETSSNERIEDREQPAQEVINPSRLPAGRHGSGERQTLANFSGSNLPGSDLAGVTAHNGKFTGSALRGSDFSGADLTGSSFKGSDMREVNFDGANLTDCSFYANDLSAASFNKSILVRTNFSTSGLDGARFVDVKLSDVKLTVTDLRKVVFENCIFDGTDFDKSDLRGVCMDGQTFTGVSFDNAALKGVSFKGATLKNVSFRSPYALTNKYFGSLKTISFEGASIDKLTCAVLKGLGVDLSKVTVI